MMVKHGSLVPSCGFPETCCQKADFGGQCVSGLPPPATASEQVCALEASPATQQSYEWWGLGLGGRRANLSTDLMVQMLSSKSYEYKIHVHLVVFVTCYHDLAWCSSNGAGMVGSKIKKDKYDPPPDSIQDEASSQKEKEDKVR
jgi:hypothetical protein